MRIAFDLDDTLIPAPGSLMPTERLGLLSRMISRESIREGAPALMRELRREGHETWIYTTSLRSPAHLHMWFASFGVLLDGVVNQARHDAHPAMASRPYSKYPPAFGIALLIDDSLGVGLEGQRAGFPVLVISEEDASWHLRVREYVSRMAKGR